MEFSNDTLNSTYQRFSHALEERGLGLSKSAMRQVWANIVLGRDYSAASSMAKAHGKVRAVPITAVSICEKLLQRSRTIDIATAESLLIESIKDELPELSPSLHELSELVQTKEQTCLVRASEDPYGFGIMDSEFAGYLGLSNLHAFKLEEDELAWYQASADIVTCLVNAAAGVGNDELDIRTTNIRLQFKKSDEVFEDFCMKRVKSFCFSIAEGLLVKFPADQITKWEVDFDGVYDVVYGVFEDAVFKDRRAWLKIDCGFADTIMDHVSARVRHDMKWMSESGDEEVSLDLFNSLAYSAKLPMERLLMS